MCVTPALHQKELTCTSQNGVVEKHSVTLFLLTVRITTTLAEETMSQPGCVVSS